MYFYRVIFILIAIILISVGIFLSKNNTQEGQEINQKNIELIDVRGISMEPALMNGEEIKIDKNFYEKNPIQTGDIVIIDFEWREDPIAKFIHAVPGDLFGLEKQNNGNFHIIINGQAIKNSEQEFYTLTYAKTRMLDLYINEFNGVIPEDRYLILGNLITGTQDSTQFGLVHKENIIGKVISK